MDPHCSRIKDLPIDATHYQVLDIKPSETNEKTVTKKYKKIALKCHPDKNDDKDGEYTEIMKRIVVANEVLSDDNKRRKYDAFLLEEIELKRQFEARATAGMGSCSRAGAAESGTQGSYREKDDLELTSKELDKRNRERYGPIKKEGEDERIRELQEWLSSWLSTIETYNPADGELTLEGVRNILNKIRPSYRDYFNKSSIIQELHYQIINALIKKLIINVSQLDGQTNEWILNEITGMTSIRRGAILPEHGDLFLDDNLFETIFTKELKENRRRLYNIIVNYRDRHKQTKFDHEGGSRRKSMHKRRNLRNKCRTTRRRHRKYRKSK
jgi:curved DNA-binding protein CbpA